MRTVADLIDELGGYAVVAAGIGMPPGTVAAWKHRKSIPLHNWSRLIEWAADKANSPITIEQLFALHGWASSSDRREAI